MILPVDLQSAQIHNNDEAPATSAEISEPARYQVFHIEHSPGSHKLFIPTSPPRPLGYIYHVTYMPFTENPQPTLHLVCDILSSPHNIGDVHDTQFVGSIASQELDHVRAMINDYPRPFNPEASTPHTGEPNGCELWVRAVINMLLEDGILEPPPPEPTNRGHRLPRHHHTAHCIHQRLHSHHPYRRRNRQSVRRNP
ncbi:hypothetical protein DER45DRAFT_268839 [Fusarium avenaceum]|nr:hypothetical protein DER45DRAFT_268839 [Fusarium avenaceum]